MSKSLPIPADFITKMRDSDILSVAQRCGAKLRRVTAAEHAGPCPTCGGDDRFSVNIRKNVFNCRSFGGGDIITMVQHVRGLDFKEAVNFIANKKMVDVPAEIQRSYPDEMTPSAEPCDKGEIRVERSIARLSRELQPIRGTLGEKYLSEQRHIDIAAIGSVLESVDAIGFHPAVYFHDSAHPLHKQRLACIVGIMTDPASARPTGAISRTYLAPDGRKIGAAKTLGSPAGIVRLSDDADVCSGLHIAEGLETALTAMSLGFRPIWSTGSTAIMRKFPVLDGIETLTIFADHDAAGAGEQAAQEVRVRWLDAGCEVEIFRSRNLGDLNDALRAA
jgi:Toprim domain/CHC2 zinc finger